MMDLDLFVFFLIIVWVILLNRNLKKKIAKLEDKYLKLKNHANEGAQRSNNQLHVLQQFADALGYCIHIDHTVAFNIASILEGKDPVHEKKLVFHKKEKEVKVKVKHLKK